ncbi:hypothetical protein [Nocardia sp. NPDC056000]|uniref:hypothetical protein n=1 Tax=Nocardia sp. NPDC056000 TaxID=3345674 RepID=UPI0035D705B6
MTIPFEYSALWAKAVVFVNRALDDTDDFEERAFWAAAALELLGKAALVKVHPVLIADTPASGTVNAKSLMLAAGVGEDYDKFVSIAAKTVFMRCKVIAPNFNEVTAIQIAGNRNAYLHAGGPFCPRVAPESWWQRYWPLASILLAAQDKSLEELVGSDNIVSVQATIVRFDEHIAEMVTARIDRARYVATRLAQGNLPPAEMALLTRRINTIQPPYMEHCLCLACGTTGELGGETEIDEERTEAAGMTRLTGTSTQKSY